MIIIRKRRLILIASMICISLTAFALKESLYSTQAVPTVNLPVSNKVIVLDARSRNTRRTVHKVVGELQKLKLI